MTDEKTYEHPSYGMIALNRIHSGGTRRLFGSHLPEHPTMIQLTISRGVRRHSLGRDSYFGREEHIRVWLSAAQFAEMVSNMQTASGVPCTVLHVQGQQAGEPPPVPSEVEEIRDQFQLDTKNLVAKVKEGRDRIEKTLDAVKLPKKLKEVLRSAYFEATRFVEDAAPFLLESFQEATTRTVIDAKQEIDAFMTHAVHQTGLDSIQAQKRLGGGDTDGGAGSVYPAGGIREE